jgi:hypothetical protein
MQKNIISLPHRLHTFALAQNNRILVYLYHINYTLQYKIKWKISRKL